MSGMASRLGEILEYIAGAYLAAFGVVYLLVVFSIRGLLPMPVDVLLSLSGLALMLLFIAPVAAIAGIIGWYIDRENRRAVAVFAIGSALAFMPLILNMAISGVTIADAALSSIILAPLGAAFIISVYGASRAKPAPHHLSFAEAPRRALRPIARQGAATHAFALSPEPPDPGKRRRALREA